HRTKSDRHSEAVPGHNSARENVQFSGQFEYIRFALHEPENLLPDTSQPLGPTRWCFGKCSKDQALDLLRSCGLPGAALTNSTHWESGKDGRCLFPASELVLELTPTVREKLYASLTLYPGNSPQQNPFRFRSETFIEWFADTGLGPEQLQLFKKLMYREGSILSFCDGALLQRLFSA